ncbi:MAG: mechanosensitive ion channel domain-containing protein [Acidimicrobiales bacterium]
MSTADWIIIAAAIFGGVVAGVIASRVVVAVVGAPSRPEPLRAAAKPLASLATSVFVVVGLIVALGVVSPSALDQLPRDVIEYLPRLLSAAILMIVANVLSSFAVTAIGPALARLPTTAQRQTLALVRGVILGLGILLGIRQLGIDTTVINLALAAVFFGLSGALMLLVALGGRHVATEVASTRVLRRLLREGDRIRTGTTEGTVVSVHPTAIELATPGGETILVPSSQLIEGTVTIERVDRADPGGEGGG